MPRKTTAALILALVAMISSAQAQLIVDFDLGSLGAGAYPLTGTTAGAGDEAAYYDVVSSFVGNWGEDYVYQFTTPDTFFYQVNTNSVTGDPDFFLLDSLATANDGVKDFATGAVQADFLDGPPPISGLPALLRPGTYYLSIDSWHGVDGEVVAQDSTWNASLSLTAVFPPLGAVPLGKLAESGQALTIDTFGSEADTELALFDSAGFIPSACGGFSCTNDDAMTGTRDSQLLIDGLAGGTYYLALGSFNTSYSEGFVANSSGSGGDYALNYPGGSLSGALSTSEVSWFTFTVGIPEPNSMAPLLLGVMFLGFVGRR